MASFTRQAVRLRMDDMMRVLDSDCALRRRALVLKGYEILNARSNPLYNE